MHNFAFFHPSSRYNQMRSHERPDNKLYGYFWCLAAESAAKKIKAPETGVGGSGQRAAVSSSTMAAASSRIVALGIGDTCIDTLTTPTCRAELAEEDGRQVFRLGFGNLVKAAGRRCRALLIHRDVFEHLQKVEDRLVGLEDVSEILSAVLQDSILDTNPRVAAILSGLPDWDGEVGELGTVAFDSYAAPQDSPPLGEESLLVLSIDRSSVSTGAVSP